MWLSLLHLKHTPCDVFISRRLFASGPPAADTKSPAQAGALLGDMSPATALCWGSLFFPIQLDICPLCHSSERCCHVRQLYGRDLGCLQGWKLQDKLQKSRRQIETSTKLLKHLPSPRSPHPPTDQSFLLYQLHGRGASVPYQQHGGNPSCPMSSFGVFQKHSSSCCSPELTSEAPAQSPLQTQCKIWFTHCSAVFLI